MTGTGSLDALYKVRKNAVDFVDVPELGYVMVDGEGAPGGTGFQEALQALYAVSYGAHFLLKKTRGDAPRVMPLEAQWWVEDRCEQDLITAVAMGTATMADSDRDKWRWRAMIVQPDPIHAAVIATAERQARAKKELPALERLRYDRWEEGRCAQVLHIGPYADETPSIVRLHEAITAAGCRPRGDLPRRSAAQRPGTAAHDPAPSRRTAARPGLTWPH